MKPVPRSLMSKVLPGGLALAALWLAGCAAQPTHYYSLAEAGDAAFKRPQTPQLAIEIAPIAVPDRLARPQLVVVSRSDGAEVHLLEQHRWAASFETELRDALSSGVAGRLGAVDLTRGGSRGDLPVWRIAVQVRQFDAVQDARVDAAVSWSVRRPESDRTVVCQWQTTEPATDGIGALARAAQRMTAGLAQRIAAQVTALQSRAGAGCPD